MPGERACERDGLVNELKEMRIELSMGDTAEERIESQARMDEIEATTYVPDRGADTGEACTAAMARGGYFGPFLS